MSKEQRALRDYIGLYETKHKDNLENRKKSELTIDSILLSLFMRTNGKCNNSYAPHSTGLSGILFSVRTQYSQRTRI